MQTVNELLAKHARAATEQLAGSSDEGSEISASDLRSTVFYPVFETLRKLDPLAEYCVRLIFICAGTLCLNYQLEVLHYQVGIVRTCECPFNNLSLVDRLFKPMPALLYGRIESSSPCLGIGTYSNSDMSSRCCTSRDAMEAR